MTRRISIAVLLFLFGGASALAGNSVVSLRTARELPAAAMEIYFPRDAWKAIAEAPISGYVILRGSVGSDHKVRINTTVESYPDRSRDALATQLADRVRIVAAKVGSHIAPAAEVFVLFYDSKEEVQQAVVFARSREGVMIRSTTNKESYLEVIDYRKKPAAKPTEAEGPPSTPVAGS